MILQGDALTTLQTLQNESIDLVLTSPPYYGLRNYGVDGQIGLEKTPQQYISNLMNIFVECKRVLKKTGSCWVNISDSYGSAKCETKIESHHGWLPRKEIKGFNKSLIGIPERFVIAMTDLGGWIRRNTIIWHKPNSMPSSAKDRFTVDFEYFYFFTKSQKYYFDTQYEPLLTKPHKPGNKMVDVDIFNNGAMKRNLEYMKKNPQRVWANPNGRMKRCVWSITTKPFKEAHFAVFPEKLIETPIKACCPPDDGVVLDPFCGSGTTCLVAKKLGRKYIGIELNPEYIQIANRRLTSIL